jgi:hypothetical protein
MSWTRGALTPTARQPKPVAPLPLPRCDAFMSNTTPGGLFTPGRGKELTAIDQALRSWEKAPLAARRITALQAILLACKHWMDSKEDKRSGNLAGRRPHVIALLDLAYAHLQYEVAVQGVDPFYQKQAASFEQRKLTTQIQGAGPVKPLHGGYGLERKMYVAGGKQADPGSASWLHGRGADLDKLSLTQFEALITKDAKYNHSIVKFFDKGDRISKLIVIENGLLWDGPNHHFDTTDGGFAEQYPYAMDKYGNLLSALDTVVKQETGRNFNHSTFNAGKEVICAGMIGAKNGRLVSIDNTSGHYKPTKDNLWRAVAILGTAGVDLTGVTCQVLVPNPKKPGKSIMYTYDAAGFARDKNVPPTNTLEE